jgi:hypothetical protein
MLSTLNDAVDQAAQDQDVVIHHQRAGRYDILADNVHYPITHLQVRDLLGKVLTHLDAMGLPDRAHRAARTLLTAEVWRWWDGVYENATTSTQGCIAPIVTGNDPNGPHSNRWGWQSEADYLASLNAES